MPKKVMKPGGTVNNPTIGGFTLLPAKPGTCPECAVAHAPEFPHNQQSLYYQYHFYAENQRWPTWEDAMSHCDKQMKEFWKDELRKSGVRIGEEAQDGISNDDEG